jgi:hypothetical protein
MGTVVSAARSQIKAADEKEEKHQKEQLEFLMVAANAKLDGYQSKLEALVYHYLSRSLLYSAHTSPHL